MILIALGANLGRVGLGGPHATCLAALAQLETLGVEVQAVSRWYESAPVPASDQPWYVNAVARVNCTLDPTELLALMHQVEAEFGRERGAANAARTLDLDLIDYDGQIRSEGEPPALPHPRAHERAFVLLPIRDIAPDWCHPGNRENVEDLISALPGNQDIRVLNPEQR